jgi:5-keto-L-gluconate epimerase
MNKRKGGKMEIGVSLSPSRTAFAPLLFSGDLEKGLIAASQLGYDGVELSLLDSSKLNHASIMRRLQELSLKVFAIATGQTFVTDGCSLYSNDAAKRRKAVERIMGHIDFAVELRCMVIIGGIRGSVEAAQPTEWISSAEKGVMAIRTCVEYAERAGIVLLIEPINRYETNVVNTLEQGMDLIDQIGTSNLKLLPDTFHMNMEEPSIRKSIIKAASAIGYVHFADSNRWAPGCGHIDFSSVVSALRESGYTGPVDIEVLPKPDDYTAAEQAIRHVRCQAEAE